MPNSLDQQRAHHAYTKIRKIRPENRTDELVGKINKFPSTIQTCGLLAAVGFYSTKGGDHKTVCVFLKDWLFDDPVFDFLWQPKDRECPLTDAISQLDPSHYRLATREALAYLVWLKRAAEALLPEKPLSMSHGGEFDEPALNQRAA